jgi:hypothetical protein
MFPIILGQQRDNKYFFLLDITHKLCFLTTHSAFSNPVEPVWISKTNSRSRYWSILSRIILEGTASIMFKNAATENKGDGSQAGTSLPLRFVCLCNINLLKFHQKYYIILLLTSCVLKSYKQPADVQTEPNFYNMPTPNQTELAIGFSPPQITAAPRESSFSGMSFADMSPVSRGMHGAAHLLKDMKSTNSSIKGKSMLESSFSLDQSTTTLAIACKEPKHQHNYRVLSPTSSLSTIQSSNVVSSPIAASNELFAVPKDRSMSLLGRVQNFPKHKKRNSPSSGIIDASSAFFWPPRKSTIDSSSQTKATFESSVTSFPTPHHSQLIQRK